MSRTAHRHIGVAAIIFAAFLFVVGIPFGVTSPSNVRNIVLSPLFWPQIVAGLLGLGGLGLLVMSRSLDDAIHEPAFGGKEGGLLRLALMVVLSVAYVLAIPLVGMVWASMVAFVLLALLIKTHHPRAAVIAAIVIPLVLYAFFAHVAGVAVPQGEFIRLP